MRLSKFKRFLVGEPIPTFKAAHERIPKWKALSTLSSDALSSVAYASDSILFVLAAFSTAAVVWSIPVAVGIVGLLAILTLSYRETIRAYPNGGGAYTVAKENLGSNVGLVAGASLLIDYVLTVAVSVASGVENLASAFPSLLPHRIALAMVVILIVVILNLRGIQESATVFSFPTYLFVFSIFSLLIVGAYRVWTGDIHEPVPNPQLLGIAYPAVPAILVLRAFASGCAALTGVEAISNGVTMFREPAYKNARTTLTWMSLILGAMFLGITALAHVLRILPHQDETLISMLARSVFGHTGMYFLVQGATASILFLAANTSFSGFPRLSSILARDRFLPRQLGSLGDRLVFSNGILGLGVAAALLVILFDGESQSLIPLYAVGVFLSFTLSQLGMVVHHLRARQPGWGLSFAINATGGVATFIVLADICFTKFTHGAWLVVVTIPVTVFLFKKIHSHYIAVGKELSLLGKKPPGRLKKIKHTVIMPVSGLHQGVLEAAQYATTISDDVRAVYVEIDSEATLRVQEVWNQWLPEIPFVVLKSPYRSVVQPLLQYMDDVEQIACDDLVTVVIPEFVTAKWWHQLLHNHTAIFIRTALAFRRRKVVTSIRYHLRGIEE